MRFVMDMNENEKEEQKGASLIPIENMAVVSSDIDMDIWDDVGNNENAHTDCV